jgi:hypothetical protein
MGLLAAIRGMDVMPVPPDEFNSEEERAAWLHGVAEGRAIRNCFDVAKQKSSKLAQVQY